jgi:hypothetical protein
MLLCFGIMEYSGFGILKTGIIIIIRRSIILNVKNIMNLCVKPALYQKGTAVMWTDPYISKQLLDVHLNPNLDLASRKMKTNVTKETSDNQKPPIEEKAPQGLETIVNPEPVSEAPKPKAKPEGVKETILKAIQSRKIGIDAKGIAKLTGFTGKQISNNMFHLKKVGLVKKKKGGKFVAIKIKESTIKG